MTRDQNWLALKGDKPLALKKELNDLHAKQKYASRKSAIIVDGFQLTIIQSSEDLTSDFVDLCTYEKVEVVLVCRVSPQQKADVVQMVKNRMPEKSTLAIGDGANDVSMITAAHIGIGISGLEGQQAARAADYSIGQFKMLKNLLFVHGREAYRRNTYLIMYMFYKNIILVVPVWVYGWLSLFGGTVIYNNIFYNFYNLALTAVPIIWYAVFDWEHDKQHFLDTPRLYAIGMNNVFFNSLAFWRWFAYATWQGILLCYLVTFTFNNAMIHDGQAAGLTLEGNYIFYAIVVVVNMKILISSFQYTWMMLFWIFGFSIPLYWLFLMLFSFAIKSSDLYGIQQQQIKMTQNYLVLIFFTFCYITIDEGMMMVNAEVRAFLAEKRLSFERSKVRRMK